MANKITQEQILEMNRLYLQLHTYASVSRAMGGSPSATTVKKYIIPDFVDPEDIEVIKKDITIAPFDKINIDKSGWGKYCKLSEEEVTDIKELWKELLI